MTPIFEPLHLSLDRKVSPRGMRQPAGVRPGRWLPQIPNSFGLPAGVSCPGKTSFCDACYGTRTEQAYPSARRALFRNARLLTEAGTVDNMTMLLIDAIRWYEAIADRNRLTAEERVFRIHWDGDFFSTDYAQAWARVIRATPAITYWAYTRSFVDPVNVVPTLAGIDNLALYLSVDVDNVDAAGPVLAEYSDVMMALCARTYEEARALSDRLPPRPSTVVPCPENSRKIELMADGVGACVSCRICPERRRDISFATTHLESLAVVIRGNGRTTCQRCAEPIPPRPDGTRGRPPKYCTTNCRWLASRAIARARQGLVGATGGGEPF